MRTPCHVDEIRFRHNASLHNWSALGRGIIKGEFREVVGDHIGTMPPKRFGIAAPVSKG
jgi:hypothetical protein